MLSDSDSNVRVRTSDKLCILYLLGLFKDYPKNLFFTRFSYTLLYAELEYSWHKAAALTSFVWVWGDEHSGSGNGARCDELEKRLFAIRREYQKKASGSGTSTIERIGYFELKPSERSQLRIEVHKAFEPKPELPLHSKVISTIPYLKEAFEWQSKFEKIYDMHKDLKMSKHAGKRCFSTGHKLPFGK